MSKLYQNAPIGATRSDLTQPTRRSDRHRRPSKPLRMPSASDDTPHFATALDGLGSPQQSIPYCDVIGGWLRDPLGPEDLAHLDSLCGGKLGRRIRKPRFRRNDRPDHEYGQRLTLRQPSSAALAYLAKRNDFFLNYSELALDRIYADRDELLGALQFVIEHTLIKNRRGASTRICLGKKGLTIYSDGRAAKHLSVTYADKKSKVAKSDLPPLHDERRTQGPAAHKRKGIDGLSDLLQLDQAKFWQEAQNYYRVHDVEGLGRAYLNYLDRQNPPPSIARRKAKLKRITDRIVMNIDKRMGYQLIRTLGAFRPNQITLSSSGKESRNET